jgi:nitrogen fixation protein FixH
MSATMPPSRPLRGRTVLLALIGFFSVVAAVNAVFIVLALRSHPGVSDDNAYQDGLAYNRLLAEAEAQRALGWSVTLAQAPAYALTLKLADRDGAPLAVKAVTARLRRPGLEAADRALVFAEIGPGLWRAEPGDLLRGNWDLAVEIARRDGEPYRADWRLWIKEGAQR